MKQIILFFAGLSVALVSQADTPQDAITQLLSKIQDNTYHTETATTKTLSQQLTTALTAQQAIQKNTQNLAENQATYLYGSKAGSSTTTALFSAGKNNITAQSSVLTARLAANSQNIDQPYLCKNTFLVNLGFCKKSSATQASDINGLNLLTPIRYSDLNAPNLYLQNLFQQDLANFSINQSANISLASGIFNSYMEQRTPASGSNDSFMSLLQNMVTTPFTNSTWQTDLHAASLADRVNTLISVNSGIAYVNYLRLQAAQKRNLLLATLVLQKAQAYNQRQQEINLLQALVQKVEHSNK